MGGEIAIEKCGKGDPREISDPIPLRTRIPHSHESTDRMLPNPRGARPAGKTHRRETISGERRGTRRRAQLPHAEQIADADCEVSSSIAPELTTAGSRRFSLRLALMCLPERAEATAGEREHEAIPPGAVVRASPRGVPDSLAPRTGPRAGIRYAAADDAARARSQCTHTSVCVTCGVGHLAVRLEPIVSGRDVGRDLGNQVRYSSARRVILRRD